MSEEEGEEEEEERHVPEGPIECHTTNSVPWNADAVEIVAVNGRTKASLPRFWSAFSIQSTSVYIVRQEGFSSCFGP